MPEKPLKIDTEFIWSADIAHRRAAIVAYTADIARREQEEIQQQKKEVEQFFSTISSRIKEIQEQFQKMLQGKDTGRDPLDLNYFLNLFGSQHVCEVSTTRISVHKIESEFEVGMRLRGTQYAEVIDYLRESGLIVRFHLLVSKGKNSDRGQIVICASLK